MNLSPTIDPTINEIRAARVTELFATLADPSRVRLIAALTGGEMHVGALAAMVGIAMGAPAQP